MIDLVRYTTEHFDAWHRLVESGENGTVFHRLDFLAYHGERFGDAPHHLIWLKGSEPIALMPMGIFDEAGHRVARSPFGASWGGLVHGGRFTLRVALEAIARLVTHLRAQEVSTCSITLPPSYCWRQYTNHFEFALCHSGFTPSNRELTHVVDLSGTDDVMSHYASTTRTQVRKALKCGVEIERDADPDVVYPLLRRRREGVGGTMTHTLEEIRRLRDLGVVKTDAAWCNGDLAAANLYVHTGHSLLSFYPSYDEAYARTSALTLLIHDAALWSQENGLQYLDLGCSSYEMDVPNPGVARFKEGFGAVGLFRDTYELDLRGHVV